MRDIHKLIIPENPQIPERLYHYTSQQGLISILSSRTLWSTRIQFLNDSTEFRYTFGLLQNAIRARPERFDSFKSTLPVDKMLDLMAKGFESAHSDHIHVACFSETGDALNLWRGYCPQGAKGFSIGFQTTQLVDATPLIAFFLLPCIYDSRKQTDLVDLVMDDFLNQVIKATRAREGSSSFKGIVHTFFDDCVFLATILKHPSFWEEREWRIVTQPIPDTNNQIGVRPGKSVLIPYFRFEVVPATKKLNVEVVVGPTPEPELSLDSARTLLQICGCEGNVRGSTVPYREI